MSISFCFPFLENSSFITVGCVLIHTTSFVCALFTVTAFFRTRAFLRSTTAPTKTSKKKAASSSDAIGKKDRVAALVVFVNVCLLVDEKADSLSVVVDPRETSSPNCCECSELLHDVTGAILKADFIPDIFSNLCLVKAFYIRQGAGTFWVEGCTHCDDSNKNNQPKSGNIDEKKSPPSPPVMLTLTYEPDLPPSTEKAPDEERIKQFVRRAVQIARNPMFMELDEQYGNLMEEIKELLRAEAANWQWRSPNGDHAIQMRPGLEQGW